MREIKFRAWNKKNKKMCQVLFVFFGSDNHTVQLYDGTEITVKNNCKDTVILMQYTGLKDKNGVEIYEGDIISTNKARPYNTGNQTFAIMKLSGGFVYNEIKTQEAISMIQLEVFIDWGKIAGNIYENLELIK